MIFLNFIFPILHAHVLETPEITAAFSKSIDGILVETNEASLWRIETGETSFLLFDIFPSCESPVIIYKIGTLPLERICNDGTDQLPIHLPTEQEELFVKYTGSEDIAFRICHTQNCGSDEQDNQIDDVQSVSLCSTPTCTTHYYQYFSYCSKYCTAPQRIWCNNAWRYSYACKRWLFCSGRWIHDTSCPQITPTTTKATTTTTTVQPTAPNVSRWHLCSTGYYYGPSCPEDAADTATPTTVTKTTKRTTTTRRPTTTTTTTLKPTTRPSIIYCNGIPFRGPQCPGARPTMSIPTTTSGQADSQSLECGFSAFSTRLITDREHSSDTNEDVEIVVTGQTFANDTRELTGSLVDLSTPPANVSATNVINGGFTVTQEGKYPWLVSIRTKRGFHFCGGAILNKNWILTAAHCKIKKSDKLVFATLKRKGTSGATTRGVGQVKTHPKAKQTRYNTWKYDFELVRLDQAIEFTDYIRPICLPTQYTPGQNCIVSGWGRISSTPVKYHDYLQEAEISTNRKGECGAYSPLIDESSFCAEGRASACNGDSGGPLVCEDSSGRAFVTGVASWASTSCDVAKPSGFGDVAAVRSWIDGIIFI